MLLIPGDPLQSHTLRNSNHPKKAKKETNETQEKCREKRKGGVTERK